MRVRVDAERPAPRALKEPIDSLRKGGFIIYPTDTGYAFGCAMTNPKGIQTLRKLKGIDERHKKPLAMLVSDMNDIGRYGHLGNRVFRVIRRILPGPYTLVLRATHEVPRAMRNRDHEVGLRMPAHRVCSALLEGLGEPLLTGSLTPGEATPELEDPEDFERRYRADVDLIVDAGPAWPDPSTVLRLVDDEIEVLREGQGPLP